RDREDVFIGLVCPISDMLSTPGLERTLYRHRFRPRAKRSDDLDARDDISFQNPIHDIDPLDHFSEDGVVPIQPQVVTEDDEPLRVARVVAAGAHADCAADVRNRAELVADEARVSNILIRPRTPALNDEVRLDALP